MKRGWAILASLLCLAFLPSREARADTVSGTVAIAVTYGSLSADYYGYVIIRRSDFTYAHVYLLKGSAVAGYFGVLPLKDGDADKLYVLFVSKALRIDLTDVVQEAPGSYNYHVHSRSIGSAALQSGF